MSTPYSSRASGVNAAVSFTVRGREGLRVHLTNVVASYVGGAVTGNILIQGANSGRSFDVDIATAGEHVFANNEDGLCFARGEDVICTLGAGGAGVTGKLNLTARWEPESPDYQY